jgi:hypothetical protein
MDPRAPAVGTGSPHRRAAVAEDPLDLADDLTGIEHVLEDGLDQHRIDALARDGDPVGIGDELRQRAAVGVEPDNPRPAIGVDRVDAVAHRPAADHEDQGRWPR